MGKINTMISNNTNTTSPSKNSSSITTRSSKALVKTTDSNNNNNSSNNSNNYGNTIIRNSNNSKVLVVEVNQQANLSKSKLNTHTNDESQRRSQEENEGEKHGGDEGGGGEILSLNVSKSNTSVCETVITSVPSSPSSSASASSSSQSLSIKETFCRKRDDIDKEKLEQNNLNTNGNDEALNNHENENVKPIEVKTSANNQNEKIINDLLTQSHMELNLQNSPRKIVDLMSSNGDLGKKNATVNSQQLSPYLSANILVNGTNLNTTKCNNNSLNSENLSNALATLNNSNENIYFMMQTPNELACAQSSSPTLSHSYAHTFKRSPSNSPTQTSNKLFLSQYQLQSILNTQNNNVLPSVTTLHNSPLVTNTISLSSNGLSSPNICIKNSHSSSSSSSNTSINTGVKGVRDERRRANHNEVERRRRDNINKWIVELSKVIPDCSNDQSKHGQSKGGILEKTVQYLLDMKEENIRLVEHIKNLEKFKYDNEALKQQNDYLLKENEILRSSKCDSLDLK